MGLPPLGLLTALLVLLLVQPKGLWLLLLALLLSSAVIEWRNDATVEGARLQRFV